jgi:hypothetical protein
MPQHTDSFQEWFLATPFGCAFINERGTAQGIFNRTKGKYKIDYIQMVYVQYCKTKDELIKLSNNSFDHILNCDIKKPLDIQEV